MLTDDNARIVIVSQYGERYNMEASFYPSHSTKCRHYAHITRSSKKLLSRIIDKAITQRANFMPYIDVFMQFPPRGEL